MASTATNEGECGPYISVVIPVFNEAENTGPLIAEVDRALDGTGDFEIILVDDGSTDDTAMGVRRLTAEFERLRIVTHKNRCGQSAAIRSGVKAALAPMTPISHLNT